jgi:tripartite-type tricarboxylate transporter receptor subunit TctC
MTRVFSEISSRLSLSRDDSVCGGFSCRPVRLIVPFPPGGPLDIVGRVLGRKLSEQWGSRW